MLKLCTNNHITGNRSCSHCGAATTPVEMPPPHPAIDVRVKRRISHENRMAAQPVRYERQPAPVRVVVPRYRRVLRRVPHDLQYADTIKMLREALKPFAAMDRDWLRFG